MSELSRLSQYREELLDSGITPELEATAKELGRDIQLDVLHLEQFKRYKKQIEVSKTSERYRDCCTELREADQKAYELRKEQKELERIQTRANNAEAQMILLIQHNELFENIDLPTAINTMPVAGVSFATDED